MVLFSLVIIAGISFMTDPEDSGITSLSHDMTAANAGSVGGSAASKVQTTKSTASLGTRPVFTQTFPVSTIRTTISMISADPATYKDHEVVFSGVIANFVKSTAGTVVGMDVAGISHPFAEVLVGFPPGVASSLLRSGNDVEVTGSKIGVAKWRNPAGELVRQTSVTANAITDLTYGHLTVEAK